jgi:hypothetical protein
MTRGDRVSLAGDTGTVEGFTTDGHSVVVLLDDGTRIFAPRPPNVTLAGITAREDLYPCATAAPVCTGRGTQRIVP